ncbi:ATP-binding protein [Shewanella algae]|uniref:ATP-binding protein n=1 Tax=Shewanella algae TaxID=38313 RepID=UPI0029356855|nr:ATP-binding protein [Shewanella algae]MDV2963863.1 ATP-binding protein [Shewanella algae]
MSQKEYSINIDPRILELLGPNLYTNIYYVLAELVANAYDANAKNVYIVSDNNSITVEDDGHGMSYEVGVKKFLNIAQESRTNEDESYVSGSDRKRRKMGRKGVGKLAALSVSENVEIKTIKDGDKSGFILSRRVGDDHKLVAIDEDKIHFLRVQEQGTSIVMKAPQYKIHKTLKAAKNNLLKIFPLVDKDFRIHLQLDNKTEIIDSFEREIIQGLGGLVTLGEEFSFLHDNFDSQLSISPEHEDKLHLRKPSYVKKLKMKDRTGEEREFPLEIKGWIGAYRSSRGKKLDQTDFPDNFISILSNKKMGEFNILPLVGKNALNEVYVVGQLHIDLFEETMLPDMALSNRQGYKSDDERYEAATRYIRDELLPTAISLRAKYASYKKDKGEFEKHKKNKEREAKFKEQVEKFKSEASQAAADEIARSVGGDTDNLQGIVKSVINNSLPNLGIKSSIDDNKKKLLISHSFGNKAVCDFIYDMLVYTGIPGEVVIYTSSDNADSRIPQKQNIFDYLRDFFVNSYSDEKVYVIYVTSDEMGGSWAAVSEVGAGWITKNQHDIFNINGFNPRKPLDVDTPWANMRFEENLIKLSAMEADIIADKLIYACQQLAYDPQSKDNILKEIRKRSAVT